MLLTAAMRSRVFIATLAAPAAFACSRDDGSNTRGPDSSESRNRSEAAWEPEMPDTIWQVDPEPALLLGEVDGPDEYLFSMMHGATRLSTGAIA